MSLLIKALEKAEEGKRSDIDELSLEPRSMNDIFIDDAPRNSPQQTAANVFSAKNVQKNQTNQQRAIAITLLVLVVIAGFGFKFYSYLQSFTQPQLVMDRPASNTAPNPAPTSVPTNDVTQAVADAPTTTTSENLTNSKKSKVSEIATAENDKPAAIDITPPLIAEKTLNKNKGIAATASSLIESTPTSSGMQIKSNKPQAPTAMPSTTMSFGEPIAVNEESKFKVTKNQLSSGVNPNLVNGYQAFNNGDYAAAQRSYREVLQSDIRNVDALLGMAAVAARQGRTNDALGWYGKVLEVDPRNNTAQAAMVNVAAQADPVSSESKLKSLIAQQPESANLYASLGDLYAEQSKWPDAQQAYFQAHHFDPQNPQYAFNLAASLDQMGKPNLALPYYEKALALLPSGSKLLDRAQLELRIGRLR